MDCGVWKDREGIEGIEKGLVEVDGWSFYIFWMVGHLTLRATQCVI
jgi:hypothetical protein